MTISSKVSLDGKELIITVQGRFDFRALHEFRHAYEECTWQPISYVIDMKETSYLDSSAMGMLLLLREHAGGDNSNIRIINCTPKIKQVLDIVNFENFFTMQ